MLFITLLLGRGSPPLCTAVVPAECGSESIARCSPPAECVRGSVRDARRPREERRCRADCRRTLSHINQLSHVRSVTLAASHVFSDDVFKTTLRNTPSKCHHRTFRVALTVSFLRRRLGAHHRLGWVASDTGWATWATRSQQGACAIFFSWIAIRRHHRQCASSNRSHSTLA